MTKKKKSKKKIIIPVVILLLVGCTIAGVIGYKKFCKSKELLVVIDKKVDVALGDKVYNTDAVKKIVNGKIVDKKVVINTDKVGKQTIKLIIEDYFKKTKKYTYEINVKDNEPPVIEAQEKLTTPYDTKIDLLKDVKATDNYDKEIEVTVEGEYDLKKAGEYKLQYVAKDSSGNETKKDVVLVVKEKVVVVQKKEETTTTNNTQNQNTNNQIEKKEETPVAEPTTNPDGSFTTSKGFHGETRNGITYINGILIANKTYSLPSTYNPGGLTGETSSAFNSMKAAAAAEGFSISVASGFRSYDLQNRLYNNYVRKYGKADADLGSARPGHSEHQSGLAFDLNTINHSSANTTTTNWVLSNCYKYGFILRYPSGKTGETGYKYEWWHLRYVGVDLATQLYNGGNWITLENYFGITSKYNY